jgi:hypothetical protein
MNITELITGLQPWDKEEYMKIGLTEKYIDTVNDANYGYRDYIMSKLNLNQSVKLHGGSINLEFGGGYDNKLPIDKITTLIETFGEEYIVNQLGGAGFFAWIRGLFGKRDFDTFKARYDKLRAELENKILIFEVESEGIKKETTTNADNMRDLLLNRKFKTMMEISIDNEPNMKQERKKAILREISLAEVKEKQLLERIKKYKEIVNEKNKKKGFFLLTLFGKGESLFDKLSKDIDKSFKEFEEIYDYFRELDEKSIDFKILKAKYGKFTADVKEKLLHSQRKEFEEWEKNKEQYAKIEAFTENHLEEAHKLMQKHEELNMIIADYNSAFGSLESQRTKAEDVLRDWDTKIRDAYSKITQCIELGSKYRNILENAKQLIIDNSNYITTLSISVVKPIIEKYEDHIKSVDLTSTIMTKLVATLAEIKNDFIKVVPSQNLQTDILFVGSARTYLLSLIDDIKRRQLLFSGGEKYVKNIIKKQVGGMYLEEGTGYDTYPLYFLHTNDSRIIHSLPYDPIAGSASYTQYVKKPATPYGIDLTAAAGSASSIIQEPYGTVLYDKTTGGMTNIATEYGKCINNVSKNNEMIMPILDFDDNVITVYKIIYKNISDIQNLDISIKKDAEIPITSKNSKNFIRHDNYFIYNLYTEDAPDIKKGVPYYQPLLLIPDTNRVILPVFKSIRSMTEMITYDEYHLLNPLTGMPILATTNTDSSSKTIQLTLKSQTDNTTMDGNYAVSGETKYYHFNAIGIKYDIENTNVTYTAGSTEKFKLPTADIEKLKDAVDYHWNIIYQLTHVINLLFHVCLDDSTKVKTNVKFGGNYKTSDDINSETGPIDIGNVKKNQTLLLLNPGDSMETVMESFFGGDPRVSVILIRTIINKNLRDDDGDLVFYQPAKTGKSQTGKTKATSVSLAVATHVKDSLTPKQRQVMDYIKRLISKTSPYWTNQPIILNLINEFYKPEYKDKFELELAELQQLIYELRKIEQGILKINININNPVDLPKYSLVTKELEIKPNELKLGETGDVITNAGKELRQLVESRSRFIKQFAEDLNIDIDNLIPHLEDAFFEIIRVSHYNLSAWFNSNPDRQEIYAAISTEHGARKLIDQILSSRYKPSIEKICGALADTVSKVSSNAAYQLYEANRGRSKPRDEKKKPKEPKYQVIQTKKPHKPHKKKTS